MERRLEHCREASCGLFYMRSQTRTCTRSEESLSPLIVRRGSAVNQVLERRAERTGLWSEESLRLKTQSLRAQLSRDAAVWTEESKGARLILCSEGRANIVSQFQTPHWFLGGGGGGGGCLSMQDIYQKEKSSMFKHAWSWDVSWHYCPRVQWKKGNDKLFTVSWIKILPVTVDRNIAENIKSNSLEDEDLFTLTTFLFYIVNV